SASRTASSGSSFLAGRLGVLPDQANRIKHLNRCKPPITDTREDAQHGGWLPGSSTRESPAGPLTRGLVPPGPRGGARGEVGTGGGVPQPPHLLRAAGRHG